MRLFITGICIVIVLIACTDEMMPILPEDIPKGIECPQTKTRCNLVEDFQHPSEKDLSSTDYIGMDIYIDSIGGDTRYVEFYTHSWGTAKRLMENKGKKVIRCYDALIFNDFYAYVYAKMQRARIPTEVINSLIVDRYQTNWFIGIFRDNWIDFDLDWIKEYKIFDININKI